MNFPQYRKYSNGKTFFCITSIDEFEELMIIGGCYTIKYFKASIFTDKILIQDMLQLTNNHWEISDESEFLSTLNYCESNLKKI